MAAGVGRVRAELVAPAAPLATARIALCLHAAAATLALGLMGGMYLRGLVLDYRAGWQSTFLQADTVQAVLSTALAPATAPPASPCRTLPACAPCRCAWRTSCRDGIGR